MRFFWPGNSYNRIKRKGANRYRWNHCFRQTKPLIVIFPRGVKVWSVSVTVIEWSGPFFHNNREYNIEIDRKTTCFIIWFCTRSFQEVLKYSHLIVKTTTLTLMNFSCGHPILTYVQQKSFNHNNTRKMFPIFQPMFSDDFFFWGTVIIVEVVLIFMHCTNTDNLRKHTESDLSLHPLCWDSLRKIRFQQKCSKLLATYTYCMIVLNMITATVWVFFFNFVVISLFFLLALLF